MQFEGRRRTSHIPNLTPLIDIVFLLLVFFMLTSHFVRDEVLDIDLPKADSSTVAEQEQQLEIVITAAGEYRINDQPVATEVLQTALQQQLNRQSEKIVRIRGDEHVELGIAITAFDAARKAGATGVDIVTTAQAASAGPEKTDK